MLPRVNEKTRDRDPECLPSRESLCPATFFRTPGSGLSRLRGLAAAVPVVDALVTPVSLLAEIFVSLVPVHAPVCQRDHVSLNLSVVRRLLQPMSTRGHTLSSCLSSHASGAFTPLLAGTNRCQLRWPFRRVAAWGAGEPRSAPPGSRAGCSTCVDEAVARAEALERRPLRALLTKSRVPSSLRPGHPGHRLDLSPGLENLGIHRAGRDPSWMQPRERPHRREDRGAFCRDGTLTRAEDCSSVRAWTAPPSRGLRGGFARGDARLCCPLKAPSPDEESASCGLDPSNQGEPKPRWNDESQRPSRHLRPNQLAG